MTSYDLITETLKPLYQTKAWWCIPLIPSVRSQRQVELCGLEASLVYIVNSRASQEHIMRPSLKKKDHHQKKLLESYENIPRFCICISKVNLFFLFPTNMSLQMEP